MVARRHRATKMAPHTRVQASIQPLEQAALMTQMLVCVSAPILAQFNPSPSLPMPGHYSSAEEKGKKRKLHSTNEKRYRDSMNHRYDVLREKFYLKSEVSKPDVLDHIIDYLKVNPIQQPDMPSQTREHFDADHHMTTLPAENDELMMESQSTPNIALRPASSSEEGPHTSLAPAGVQEPATNNQLAPGLSLQPFPRPDEGEDSPPHRETEGNAARAQSNATLTLTNSTSPLDQALRHTVEIWRGSHEKMYNESLQFQQSMTNILKPGEDPAIQKSDAFVLIDKQLNLLWSTYTELCKKYSHLMTEPFHGTHACL